MNSPVQSMDWLARLPTNHLYCLECGAGVGEVAQYMEKYFQFGFSMDQDPRHLGEDIPGVSTICGRAEQLPFRDDSIDLIVAVQSLHYFDYQLYVGEAKRVLRDGGIFAALCWGEVQLPNQIAPAYKETLEALDPFWEASREWVISGYDGIEFSADEIPLPLTNKTQKLSLDDIDLTIAGWTAMRRAIESNAYIPDPDLSKVSCDASFRYVVSWPLLGKVFRI